jgi:uncharacterized membrane protein YeaQ/YmgE (transglycosylase-associated protein family)
MFELSWTWALLIGTVAGGFSRYALRGRNPGGLVAAVMVGMAGSLAAVFLGDRFGWYRADELLGFIMCGFGAALLLGIFRFVTGTSEGAGGRQNYDL